MYNVLFALFWCKYGEFAVLSCVSMGKNKFSYFQSIVLSPRSGMCFDDFRQRALLQISTECGCVIHWQLNRFVWFLAWHFLSWGKKNLLKKRFSNAEVNLLKGFSFSLYFLFLVHFFCLLVAFFCIFFLFLINFSYLVVLFTYLTGYVLVINLINLLVYFIYLFSSYSLRFYVSFFCP